LERTVEFARKRGDFDPKKLLKALRVAMGSMPLERAGPSRTPELAGARGEEAG
jgi:hypothetical protein